jgi:hypothetical protein
MRRRHSVIVAPVLAAALASGIPAAADVLLEIDRTTVNRILGAVAVQEVPVPIAPGQTVRVLLEDMNVTGFEPAAAAGGTGHILTSVRVRAPAVGLDVRLAPRLSLDVTSREGVNELEVRFEQLPIRVPLFGSLDIAAFVPSIRYPADNAWVLAGSGGASDVNLTSRLVGVETGREALRLRFQVDVGEP